MIPWVSSYISHPPNFTVIDFNILAHCFQGCVFLIKYSSYIRCVATFPSHHFLQVLLNEGFLANDSYMTS